MIYLLEVDDQDADRALIMFVESDHEDQGAVAALLLATPRHWTYGGQKVVGVAPVVYWKEGLERPPLLWEEVGPRDFYTYPEACGRGDDSAPEDPTGRAVRILGRDAVEKVWGATRWMTTRWMSAEVPDLRATLREDVLAATTPGLLGHLVVAWWAAIEPQGSGSLPARGPRTTEDMPFVRALERANLLRYKERETT